MTTASALTKPVLPPPSPELFAGLIATVANFDLLQETRIKVELPKKAIERQGVDVPEWLVGVHGILDDQETLAEKRIRAEWRTHPLAPWAEDIHGLGAHSCAVLVAYLNGDPFIAYPQRWAGSRGSGRVVADESYERTVSQLWAYCGYDPNRSKRFTGMSQDDLLAFGKPRAKARVRMIAESFMKASNEEYRAIYDATRAQHADSELTLLHQHNRALRKMGKAFLKALWIESRRLHLEGEWR